MASTNFQDYNQQNPITSAWLNDVNNATYMPTTGTRRGAPLMSAAWVRFSIIAGVINIQQSSNINLVTRTGVGVYVITYTITMSGVGNSYGFSMSAPGFMAFTNETTTTVTVTVTDTTNAAFDPANVSVQIYGAN